MTSMILRMVCGPAAAQPPRRWSFFGSKSACPMSIWKIVSLPDVSVQRSASSIFSTAPASKDGSVTRHAPKTSAASAESVEPPTWKNGRQLK